jgi:putative phosphoesterase
VILGILSDTHGQRQHTATAIRLLQQAGAEAFVHCGDLGGVEVLEELAGLPAWVVLGNSDYPDAALTRYAEALGLVAAPEVPLRIRLAGRSIAVFHGHEPEFSRVVGQTLDTGKLPANFGECDYLLHGHTHVACDAFVGPVRVINPGALHRALARTVATLDLETDKLSFWQVHEQTADLPATPSRPETT